MLTIVAKKLLPGRKKPIYGLLNEYLGVKSEADSDLSIFCIKIVKGPRCIANDDLNKKIISEDIVMVLLQYDRKLRAHFCVYFQTNYNKPTIVNFFFIKFLRDRELMLQNQKMSLHLFLKLMRESEIVPTYSRADQISDIASRVAVRILLS